MSTNRIYNPAKGFLTSKLWTLEASPPQYDFPRLTAPLCYISSLHHADGAKKNVENIRTLAEGKSGEFDFIGISVSSEGLDEYVSENKWNFNVLRDVSDITRNSLKIGGTPQTIVLSKNGEVLKSWRGAYMSTVKDDVENFFGIRLPGIGGQ